GVVDAGGVRPADDGDAGPGGGRPDEPEPGTAVGGQLPRGGGRPAGPDGHSGAPAGVRLVGGRRAGARRHRPGGAVEPGGVAGTGGPRRAVVLGRRGGVNRSNRTGRPGPMRSPSTSTVEDFSSALFPAGDQFASLVEGLRMVQDFGHRPVMVEEVVDLFSTVPAGVVVDATAGGGGHAAALLDAYPHLGILGLDRDPAALEAAGR